MEEYSLHNKLLKILLAPGYLYGIGADGEVYVAKVKLPEAGETIKIPPWIAVEKDDNEKIH